MPVQLPRETYNKLKRMVELHAIINRDPEAPNEEASEEYRTLLPEIVDDFMPVLEMLSKAGLLVVNIEDKTGEYVPHYHQVAFDVVDVWDNGAFFLQAGPLAQSSLPRHKPGKEPLLHTWNAADGHNGKPARRITTWTGKLMERAYLAGGEQWGDGTKPGSILAIDVTSTTEPTQPEAEYNFFFEHYRPWEPQKWHVEDGIALVACQKNDGGEKAGWNYEIALGKPSRRLNKKGKQSRIDYIILDVTRHHTKEMRRLRRKYQRAKG